MTTRSFGALEIPKPRFPKLNLLGCRLRIKLKNMLFDVVFFEHGILYPDVLAVPPNGHLVGIARFQLIQFGLDFAATLPAQRLISYTSGLIGLAMAA